MSNEAKEWEKGYKGVTLAFPSRDTIKKIMCKLPETVIEHFRLIGFIPPQDDGTVMMWVREDVSGFHELLIAPMESRDEFERLFCYVLAWSVFNIVEGSEEYLEYIKTADIGNRIVTTGEVREDFVRHMAVYLKSKSELRNNRVKYDHVYQCYKAAWKRRGHQ
jgi:hypothetical protein